jgi:MFS family permease
VAETGHLWTVFGAAAAGGGALLGLLADHIGIRRAILVSLALLLLAGLIMAFHPVAWFPLLAAGAFGISYGAVYGLTPAYVAKMLPLERASIVFGLSNVMIGTGGILGNLLAGYSQVFTGRLQAIYIGVAVAAGILLTISWCLDDDRQAGGRRL